MNRARWLSLLLCSTLLVGVPMSVLADRHTTKAPKGWHWQKLAPLFPHVPGSRWVYAVSGRQYPNGGELHIQVKGHQHLPSLKQEVLLFEETHPKATADATPEITPILYYPREGYLVRDTSYIYSNPQRTSLLSTGNLGEAVSPVLPLWRNLDGSDWKPVALEHWGKAANLDISYRIDPRKRVRIAVQAGEYTDCVLIEGAVKRTADDGYRYHEWYAPGVGMVKGAVSDMKTGEILALKELVSFHPASPTMGKK